MKYQLLIGFFLIACMMSCQQRLRYEISGSWEGGDGGVVFLTEDWDSDTARVIDSAIVRNGVFRMSKVIDHVRRAVLRVDRVQQAIMLDEEPITIEIKGFVKGQESLNHISISGSPEQDLLERTRYLTIVRGFSISFGVSDEELQKNTSVIDQCIDSNLNKIGTAYFLQDLIKLKYPISDIEEQYERLTPEVKNSFPGMMLKRRIEDEKQFVVGGIVPDIHLSSLNGKELPLYSLRGKYVLVDFWASWCDPCRKEIPNLKKIYDKYRNRGFEIYSVSLDNDQEAWKKAIAALDLPWKHVSSLKGWECPVAKQYKVTSIPRMFLLDKEGRVIATDLHGELLEERIEGLFD